VQIIHTHLPTPFFKHIQSLKGAGMFGGKELNCANPYRGKSLNKFIPTQILNKTFRSRYEDELIEYSRFIRSLNEVPSDYPEKNLIHPFLEESGALRVEVPLPKSGREFITLVTIILGNRTSDNIPNDDDYQVTETEYQKKGMLADDLPLKRVEIKNEPNPRDNRRRQLAIWEDACGTYDPQKKGSRNFFILVCSILFQQTDLREYGKRGRYGPKTLHRLIDGTANGRDALEEKALMLSLFWIDMQTGMPYGFYNTGFYKTDKTIFLNYTFLVDPVKVSLPVAPNSPSVTVKATSFTIAAAAKIYSEKTNVPVIDMNIILHTDKMLAALSTGSLIERLHDNNFCESMCERLFKDISTDKNSSIFEKLDGQKLVVGYSPQATNLTEQEKRALTKMEMIYAVDQSTVPINDPGEEAPEPNTIFYKILYSFYRGFLFKRIRLSIPQVLQNGQLYPEEINEIANFAMINDRDVSKWLKSDSSFQGPGPLLIEGNLINSAFPLNNANVYEKIDEAVMIQSLDLRGMEAIKEIRQKVARVLTRAAKRGNTGNYIYGENLPRLTEFAIFMIGRINMRDPKNEILLTLHGFARET